MHLKTMAGALMAVCLGLGSAGAVDDAVSPSGKAEKAGEKSLMLFCGAGVRVAAESLIAAFQKQHGVKIDATYGGSGHLMGQISTYRRGDIFLPGDDWYVDEAVAKGLALKETKRVLAYFVPVIIVPKGNPAGVKDLRDFSRPGIRIGIGDPRACAIGKQTLKILAKNKIEFDSVKPQAIYQSSTVEELGVATGMRSIDAALVWDITARHFAEKTDAIPLSPDQNIISPIAVIVLKSAADPDRADAFGKLGQSPEGQKLLAENGWTLKP